tara:strand:+ start:187 stop:405 length:219 start_codon:yes stop_codon:yes gene_type:complete
MAKTMIYDAALTRKFKRNAAMKGMKVTSHGSCRTARKPNSPRVLRAERAKAAANFGKNADFRRDMYGIVDSE